MPRSYTPPGGHHDPAGNPLLSGDEQLRQVDLCFVMDSTGSMGSYIEATRRELKNLVQKLSTHTMKPKMAYALVLYRDHPPQDYSFVTQRIPLTERLEEAQQALDRARADGGGDGPEALIDGLYDAIYTMQWRKGSHKVILLAGDAPPHGEGGEGDQFPEGCPCGHMSRTVAQEAREKGITIFCLGIGNDTVMQKSFQQIAKLGGGQYVPLSGANTLIKHVLTITMGEFGKVDVDRVVFAAYRPGITPQAIAAATSLNVSDVVASIDRLRRKEMIR